MFIMYPVEVNIGTKLNAENGGDALTAHTAIQYASDLMRHCAGKDLRFEGSLSPSERLSILTDCTELIVRLTRISLQICHEPLPSAICVYPELCNTLSDAGISVMTNIAQMCLLISSKDDTAPSEFFKRALRNSSCSVCIVAAKLGETDLEPFISEHLRVYSPR